MTVEMIQVSPRVQAPPPVPAQPVQAWRDIFYTARDGLRLYARHYPQGAAPTASHRPAARPVVCLAGLTRNSRDFHDLAMALSPARDVYALDYRGRGRSEYDSDWRNYTPYFETLDVLDFMTLHGLHDTTVIGTSRGGIIAMIMGTVRPGAIGAVVLNDIGPVIQANGLIRIVGYVGRIPLPKDWPEATRLVREISRRDFPAITEAMWRDIAHQSFDDVNGQPGASYDTGLSRAFSLTEVAKGVPTMWPQFMTLARVPVLVIRGENSDILTPRTVQEMAARHPQFTSITVPGQGHAPFLKDRETIQSVLTFLAGADATHHARTTAPFPASMTPRV